jgi:hypothetical protein
METSVSPWLRAIKRAQGQARALARFVMAPPVAPRGCLEAAGRARQGLTLVPIIAQLELTLPLSPQLKL